MKEQDPSVFGSSRLIKSVLDLVIDTGCGAIAGRLRLISESEKVDSEEVGKVRGQVCYRWLR